MSKFTFIFVIYIPYKFVVATVLLKIVLSFNPSSRDKISLHNTLAVLENSEYDCLLLIWLSFFTFISSVTYYQPFISARRTPFSYSCRAGLVVMNSFSFSLSGKVFISLLFLKEIFWVKYSWLAVCFSSFSTLTISIHYFLACKVSALKFAGSHIGILLNVTYFLSFIVFSIFVCVIFDNLIVMCLGELFFELNLIGNLWASCTRVLSSFPRFGKF